MAVMTGKTPSGLPFPIPNIDVFDPAAALRELAEAAAAGQGHGCPHRVGDILETTNPENPGVSWPGTTWVAYGPGRVTIATGSNGTTNYPNLQATGGADTVTLTAAQSGLRQHHHGGVATTRSVQLMSHEPGIDVDAIGDRHTTGFFRRFNTDDPEQTTLMQITGIRVPDTGTGPASGQTNTGNAMPLFTRAIPAANALQAHENRPSFITVHRWQRTA